MPTGSYTIDNLQAGKAQNLVTRFDPVGCEMRYSPLAARTSSIGDKEEKPARRSGFSDGGCCTGICGL